MNTVARMGAAVALMWGVGCASPDWIDRTLVTVDVTGTWEGSAARSNCGNFQLSLEQQGSQVKGFIRSTGLFSGALSVAGQLEGVGLAQRLVHHRRAAFLHGSYLDDRLDSMQLSV